MILQLLKTNRMLLLLILPVVGIALWTKTLFGPSLIDISTGSFVMPIYEFLFKMLDITSGSKISIVFGLVLLLFQALLLIRLNSRFSVSDSRSYLPAIIFVIIASSYLQLQRLHPIFISNIFLFFALDLMFESFAKENSFGNYFLAGLLISLSSLLYINMMFFLLLIWGGLLILKDFNWREWVSSIMGILLPYIFIYSYYYLFSLNLKEISVTIYLNLIFSNFKYLFGTYYIIYFSFIGVLMIAASAYMVVGYKYQSNSSRNYMLVYLWLLMLTVLVYLVVPSASVELLIPASIPLSHLLATYLTSLKPRWVADTVFLIFIAMVAFVQYMN